LEVLGKSVILEAQRILRSLFISRHWLYGSASGGLIVSTPTSTDANAATPRPAPSARRVLLIVLPIAAVLSALYLFYVARESRVRSDLASTVMGKIFASAPIPSGSMAFADADNDMVADPPKDAAKLINPDTLVFSYVASEERGQPEEAWKELAAALKGKTGKEVKVAHFDTPEQQLVALKNGELHILGLNTGLVQSAVEKDGFVPLCTMGRDDGSFGYTMEFIVPAGSPTKKLEDIKGRKVTFSRLDSNSGCKAPLVLLKEKYNLLPERDYDYGFSQGHEDSIKRIATKEFEIAPVASDILAGMIEKKEVDPAAFVSIYKSERFPPATIGYAHNLAPELRDAIRLALLKFEWKGTGLEKNFGAGGTTKFVPVNYKDDWADTRRIDQIIAEARKASAQKSRGT
jgi:phosphonate transport system substrate-binding protein